MKILGTHKWGITILDWFGESAGLLWAEIPKYIIATIKFRVRHQIALRDMDIRTLKCWVLGHSPRGDYGSGGWITCNRCGRALGPDPCENCHAGEWCDAEFCAAFQTDVEAVRAPIWRRRKVQAYIKSLLS